MNNELVKKLLATVGSNGMTVLTVIGFLGWINPDDSAKLLASIHKFNDAMVQAVGALGQMWLIIAPMLGAIALKLGISSPTLQGILAKLTELATTGTQAQKIEVQKQAASVVAEMPLVTGVVTAPVIANDQSTPNNVVSDPKLLPKAA